MSSFVSHNVPPQPISRANTPSNLRDDTDLAMHQLSQSIIGSGDQPVEWRLQCIISAIEYANPGFFHNITEKTSSGYRVFLYNRDKEVQSIDVPNCKKRASAIKKALQSTYNCSDASHVSHCFTGPTTNLLQALTGKTVSYQSPGLFDPKLKNEITKKRRNHSLIIEASIGQLQEDLYPVHDVTDTHFFVWTRGNEMIRVSWQDALIYHIWATPIS